MELQEFADVFDALADTPAEAENLKVRSDLLSALTDRVKAWELPRSAAAKRLQVTPARLDDLLRGKISRFSRDDLVVLTAAAEVEPVRGPKCSNVGAPIAPKVPSPATTLKAACGAAALLLRKP